MEIKKEVVHYKEDVVDVICDCCKKSCRILICLPSEDGEAHYNIEALQISHTFGYGSLKDGDTHELDLCESCWDAVRVKLGARVKKRTR